MIPPKVVLKGDVAEAEKLRGMALSQLRLLHDAMKFQGLKQLGRQIRFKSGCWIKLYSSFGLDLVTVFAPAEGFEAVVPIEEIGFFIWDENSDDRATEELEANIFVLGGVPPFKWSLGGRTAEVCSLEYENTVDRSNILYYNGGSIPDCLAIIIVYDSSGLMTTGYVKVGEWVYEGQRSAQCSESPYWQDCIDVPACNNYVNEIIEGDEKWVFDGNPYGRCQKCDSEVTWGSGGGGWADPPCGDPITCLSPPYRPACSGEGCICTTYFVYYYLWEDCEE